MLSRLPMFHRGWVPKLEATGQRPPWLMARRQTSRWMRGIIYLLCGTKPRCTWQAGRLGAPWHPGIPVGARDTVALWDSPSHGPGRAGH
jgi:hypothetical protein